MIYHNSLKKKGGRKKVAKKDDEAQVAFRKVCFCQIRKYIMSLETLSMSQTAYRQQALVKGMYSLPFVPPPSPRLHVPFFLSNTPISTHLHPSHPS